MSINPKERTMRRRLIIVLAALAVAVLSACQPQWGPGYCYGEGGTRPTCVSPGNPGTAP